MDTNNVKIDSSKIKDAGSNLKKIALVMLIAVIISVIQVIHISSGNLSSKNLVSVTYVYMFLHVICLLIVLINLFDAGNNLINCEDGLGEIPINENISSEIKSSKTGISEFTDDGFITLNYIDGIGKLLCTKNDLIESNWDEANKLVQEIREGGFTDWRLPTIEELKLIYSSIHRKNFGGFKKDMTYLSNKLDGNNPVGIYFGSGGENYLNKNSKASIRAVRTI